MEKFSFSDNRDGEPGTKVMAALTLTPSGAQVTLFIDAEGPSKNIFPGAPWSKPCRSPSSYPRPVPDGCVVVSNWSEFEGMPELLLRAGVIAGAPLYKIETGYVAAPVYRLTSRFLASQGFEPPNDAAIVRSHREWLKRAVEQASPELCAKVTEDHLAVLRAVPPKARKIYVTLRSADDCVCRFAVALGPNGTFAHSSSTWENGEAKLETVSAAFTVESEAEGVEVDGHIWRTMEDDGFADAVYLRMLHGENPVEALAQMYTIAKLNGAYLYQHDFQAETKKPLRPGT